MLPIYCVSFNLKRALRDLNLHFKSDFRFQISDFRTWGEMRLHLSQISDFRFQILEKQGVKRLGLHFEPDFRFQKQGVNILLENWATL